MASSKVKRERFIAEIFKVVYKGKDVEPYRQLGTIKIRNRKYFHYIYEVDHPYQCKSTIKQGDELVLTGPTKSSITCPSGYLLFDVDLFCGAFEESILVNWMPSYVDQVCHSDVKTIKSKYNEEEEISIHFGMFYRATEALIEVSWSTTDSPFNDFNGSVVAHTSAKDGIKYSSSLFSNMKVESGEPIPLSRSIVAVPLGSELSLEIYLYNDDKSVELNDLLSFDAKLDGAEEKTGTNCKICAKVTWNANYHSRGELNEICNYEE